MTIILLILYDIEIRINCIDAQRKTAMRRLLPSFVFQQRSMTIQSWSKSNLDSSWWYHRRLHSGGLWTISGVKTTDHPFYINHLRSRLGLDARDGGEYRFTRSTVVGHEYKAMTSSIRAWRVGWKLESLAGIGDKYRAWESIVRGPSSCSSGNHFAVDIGVIHSRDSNSSLIETRKDSTLENLCSESWSLAMFSSEFPTGMAEPVDDSDVMISVDHERRNLSLNIILHNYATWYTSRRKNETIVKWTLSPSGIQEQCAGEDTSFLQQILSYFQRTSK